MGKGKMSLLDVRSLVKELRHKLVGLRVANIYNLPTAGSGTSGASKTLLFKLSATDQKQLLLVESGVRMHTTKYAREHDKLPSNFCAKLRKHLRLKRLESIEQIGLDRIVDMQFGTGQQAYHLILEFYAQGNIILTDSSYRIIMLLRVHTYASAGSVGGVASIGAGAVLADGDAPAAQAAGKDHSVDDDTSAPIADDTPDDRVAVHEPYPMNQAQQIPDAVTESMILECLKKQSIKEVAELAAFEAKVAAHALEESTRAALEATQETTAGAANQQGKKQNAKEQDRIKAARRARDAADAAKKLSKPKMKQGMPLKAILAQDLHFGPDLIEHCLMKGGIDPNQTLAQFVDASKAASGSASSFDLISSSDLSNLCRALSSAPALLKDISESAMPGYIFWREEKEGEQTIKSQQQSQQAKQAKPTRREKKNDKDELVVDEIDRDPTQTAPQTQSPATATDESKSSTLAAPVAVAAAPVVSASSPAVGASSSSAASKPGIIVYTEYLPILLAAQSEKPEYRNLPPPLKYESFDEAMDEFYSKSEEQKEQVRLVKERAAALQKLDREKARQQAQVQALEAQQALSTYKAELIESHLDAVNACIVSVNEQIATGIDWRDLTRMIKEERQHGNNPIAKMIHSLKLLENQITILLSEGLVHLQPGYVPGKDRSIKVVQVDIDLGLTAFANAQLYYQMKKRHAEKQQRAESASQAAIKAAERKTNSALASVDIRARIQKIRKIYWFEKFHWMISSEGFLIIGGKDAQQNEMIVKKYLRATDIYVHAEVHGASSVVVRNHLPGLAAAAAATAGAAGGAATAAVATSVPPLTLAQAGTMTICRSNAWKDKIQVEAYWVHADQVSKTPPTGLYLPTGSFMIRGKKNFLPRMPLIMGIGLLFRVDDECRAKHAGERRIRTVGEYGGAGAAIEEEDKYDQVGELPESNAHANSGGKAASNKKKTVGSSSSKKKKSVRPPVDLGDVDVTSNLRPSASAAAVAAAIGRLTSEDDATDDEAAAKIARLDLIKDAAAATPATQPQGKKKMSAAERKRMKKAATGSGANNAPEEKKQYDTPTNEAAAAGVNSDSDSDDDWGTKKKDKKKKKSKSSASASASASAPAKPLPRGKKNKLKRTAAKYANQDEEDLELAASLLGLQNLAKKKKELAQREAKFKAPANAAHNDADTDESDASDSSSEDDVEGDGAQSAPVDPATVAPASDDSTKICFLCKSRGHVFKTCPQRDAAGDAATPSFAQARKEAEHADQIELEALKEEEGLGGEEEEDSSQANELIELHSLTGKPFADDLSHFILPVCAPYDALADYKFKLKILPGTAKKGKAAKQALALFLAQEKVTSSERDLLKLVPDQDVINVLLSNLKLSAPGQQSGPGGKVAKKTKNKPKTSKQTDE